VGEAVGALAGAQAAVGGPAKGGVVEVSASAGDGGAAGAGVGPCPLSWEGAGCWGASRGLQGDEPSGTRRGSFGTAIVALFGENTQAGRGVGREKAATLELCSGCWARGGLG